MRNDRFSSLVLFGVLASGMIQGDLASAVGSSENSDLKCNKSLNNSIEKKNLKLSTELEKKEFKENRDIQDKDILKNNKDEVSKTGSNVVKLSRGLTSTNVVPLKGRGLAAESEQRDKGLIYTGGLGALLSLAGRLVKRYIDSKGENESRQGKEIIYDHEDNKKSDQNRQEEKKNLWKVSFKYIGKSLLYIIIIALVVLSIFVVCYFCLKSSLRKKLLNLKSNYKLNLECKDNIEINILGPNSGNFGSGSNITTNLKNNIIQNKKTGNLFNSGIGKIESTEGNNENFVEGLGQNILPKGNGNVAKNPNPNIPNVPQLSYGEKVDALLDNLGILGLFKFNSGINQAGIGKLIILLNNLVDYNAEEFVDYDVSKQKEIYESTDCLKSLLSAVKIENKMKAYYSKREKDNVAAHFAILLNNITDEGARNFAKILNELYLEKEDNHPYCDANKLGLLLNGLNNSGLDTFSKMLGDLNDNGVKRFAKLIKKSHFPPAALVNLLNKLVDTNLLIGEDGRNGLDNFISILNADCDDVVVGTFYISKTVNKKVEYEKKTAIRSFNSNLIDFFNCIQCDLQRSNELFRKFVKLLKHLNNFGVSNFIRVFNRFVDNEFNKYYTGYFGAHKFANFLVKLDDESIENLAKVLNTPKNFEKGAKSFAILLNFLKWDEIDMLAGVFTKLGPNNFVTLLKTFEEEEDLKKQVNYEKDVKPEPNLGVKKGGAARFAEDLDDYSHKSIKMVVDELINNLISSDDFINYIGIRYGNIKQFGHQEINTNSNFI